MTDKALQKNETKKFFFHMNIFDDDVEDEVEETPPPPVFSEEELADARKSGYEKGKADGSDEASKAEKSSRAQLVATVLQQIGEKTDDLFTQEQKRGKLYEREAVELCLHVFEKMFPHYNKEHGFEELKASISNILEKQQNQIKIQIYVQPDIVEAIQKMIAELKNKGFQAVITVEADENLPHGGCKMSWHDGGALHDPEALAEQIKALMQQTLAGTAPNSHDKEERFASDAPVENSTPDEMTEQNTDNEVEKADE
ncbi:MAG: hypothetical protein KDJ35_02155 [Alphaproteobacteria bacterium]|nr:hypothetical protein [Alphaproteobacteria bacterium]